MIRANEAPGSPTLSAQPQAHGCPRRHSCRWAWCRLTFAINAELVHHVIHDHVRQAPPVMRNDIPMLKRAEEGIGESMSGFETSYPDATYPSHENRLSSRPKPTIRVSTEAEPSSSLPSPPASSPPLRSPISSNGEATRSLTSSFRDASQSSSPNIQQLSTNTLARHDTPTTSQPQSTENRYTTPTFASLSSPAASPALSTVPGSPSFDSLVYEATSGKRKRTDECFPRAQSPSSQLQDSQEFQNSFSSCGSQDAVERQLTQSMDLDDDDAEYSHPSAQVTRPQAESENAITSQKDEVISQTTPYRSLPLLQTQRHSPPTMSTLNTPTHTPTTSVRKQQPWYGHPQKKRKSRQSSGVLVTNVYQTATAGAGLSASKPSMMHSTHGDRRPSWNVFQSGTLQITPPGHGGSTHDAGSQSRSPIGWSQTQTQTSWLLHESCPPLQTQAPYQSQSSSQ